MSKLLLKLLCENEENDSYINITLHLHQVCYALSRHEQSLTNPTSTKK